MSGTLLITIKNGRGVITYGVVNSPKVYNCNMRRALFFAVVFATCSVCVFGDLEIYPGKLVNADELFSLLVFVLGKPPIRPRTNAATMNEVARLCISLQSGGDKSSTAENSILFRAFILIN